MKMRVISRFAVLLMVLFTIGATAAFAGGSGESASGPVKINFWAGFTGPDKMGMQRIVDAFQKENPTIQVDFFTAPWTEVFTKFGASFGTSSAPDLLVMHVPDISQFASRSMLTDVGSLASSVGIKPNDYPQEVWEGQSYAGKQYGVPLDFHPMAVYKNVAMFKKAGLDPAMSFDSKEKFLEAAQKLTVKDNSGKVVQYGLAIGSNHSHTMRYWYGLLYQAGGTFLTPDYKKAAFNSDAGVKALTYLRDLILRYKVAPVGETDIDRDWLSGQVAMVIEGPWWVPGAVENGSIEFLTTAFPTIFDKPGAWAGSHTLTLPVQSNKARQSAAQKLMKYVATHSVAWGAAGQIPASQAVRDSAEYKALPTYKYFQTFMNESGSIHFEPKIKENAEFGADNQLSPVMNAIFGVVLGEKEPKAALDEAAQKVDAILQGK